MKENAEHMRFSILVLVLLVSLIAAPAVAQDVIKIGVIYSLSGPAASVAKAQKNAAELAIKDVNEAGGVGIGGKKMQLEAVIGDDQAKGGDGHCII